MDSRRALGRPRGKESSASLNTREMRNIIIGLNLGSQRSLDGFTFREQLRGLVGLRSHPERYMFHRRGFQC